MLGSRVLPDLLETIKRVVARLIFFSTLRICAGSVESRMCKRGKPSVCGYVNARTSGQRLDPPIPSSKISENPAPFTSFAKLANVAELASCSSTMPSHPSHLDSSSFVQRVESPFQSDTTFPTARQSLTFFFTSSSRPAGKEARRLEEGRVG